MEKLCTQLVLIAQGYLKPKLSRLKVTDIVHQNMSELSTLIHAWAIGKARKVSHCL